jgi:hypothetical protein
VVREKCATRVYVVDLLNQSSALVENTKHYKYSAQGLSLLPAFDCVDASDR